jgi:hypothetical protein
MARDLFHNIVKQSLQAEGWEITHDPFPVDYGDVQMQIDLGAAIGQYLNYRYALRKKEPNRTLYLAIPSATYDEFFRLRFIEEIVQDQQVLLLIYNVQTGDIQWIN